MPDEDWKRARQLAEHQHWLVSSEQLRTIGLTPNQIAARLRGGSWAALLHGVYLVDADMYDDITDETWWRAALLAHGPSAMLVGRTGARALGAQGLPLSDPAIEIGLVGGIARVVRTLESPGRGRDAPRVVVRQLPLLREDVVVVQGLRVRRALPTIIDAGLQLDRAHALALLDSALHLGLVDDASLAEGIAASSPRRGCRKLQEVGTLADGRAESPLESRVRLACIDGDLAPDELQYEVKNAAGRLVAIGDLAWVKNRRRPLIAEADGADVHGKVEALFKDRSRGNSLVIRSCDTIRFTWRDAMTPEHIQNIVRAALAAA